MQDCIFCKIVNGDLPAKIIYQDEEIIAFDDIHPIAPIHKLIVPRKHIATLNDLSSSSNDKNLISNLMLVAQKLASEFNIDKSGYRVLVNCNKDSGQLIYHLHLHLLGGRPLAFAC